MIKTAAQQADLYCCLKSENASNLYPNIWLLDHTIFRMKCAGKNNEGFIEHASWSSCLILSLRSNNICFIFSVNTNCVTCNYLSYSVSFGNIDPVLMLSELENITLNNNEISLPWFMWLQTKIVLFNGAVPPIDKKFNLFFSVTYIITSKKIISFGAIQLAL